MESDNDIRCPAQSVNSMAAAAPPLESSLAGHDHNDDDLTNPQNDQQERQQQEFESDPPCQSHIVDHDNANLVSPISGEGSTSSSSSPQTIAILGLESQSLANSTAAVAADVKSEFVPSDTSLTATRATEIKDSHSHDEPSTSSHLLMNMTEGGDDTPPPEPDQESEPLPPPVGDSSEVLISPSEGSQSTTITIAATAATCVSQSLMAAAAAVASNESPPEDVVTPPLTPPSVESQNMASDDVNVVDDDDEDTIPHVSSVATRSTSVSPTATSTSSMYEPPSSVSSSVSQSVSSEDVYTPSPSDSYLDPQQEEVDDDEEDEEDREDEVESPLPPLPPPPSRPPTSALKRSHSQMTNGGEGDESSLDGATPLKGKTTAAVSTTPTVAKAARKSLRVAFRDVTVFYFPRSQGFTGVPSDGGSTLGMSKRHADKRTFTLAEHEQERKRLHREFILKKRRQRLEAQNRRFQQHADQDKNFSDSDSAAEDDDDEEDPFSDLSDSEIESDPLIFVQPLTVKERRALLRSSGVRKIDIAEKYECNRIRQSREYCGCDCDKVCESETCGCALAGIKCQVDRPNFPCGCSSRLQCANPHGRTEFQPERVKGHYDATKAAIQATNGQEYFVNASAQQHQYHHQHPPHYHGQATSAAAYNQYPNAVNTYNPLFFDHMYYQSNYIQNSSYHQHHHTHHHHHQQQQQHTHQNGYHDVMTNGIHHKHYHGHVLDGSGYYDPLSVTATTSSSVSGSTVATSQNGDNVGPESNHHDFLLYHNYATASTGAVPTTTLTSNNAAAATSSSCSMSSTTSHHDHQLFTDCGDSYMTPAKNHMNMSMCGDEYTPHMAPPFNPFFVTTTRGLTANYDRGSLLHVPSSPFAGLAYSSSPSQPRHHHQHPHQQSQTASEYFSTGCQSVTASGPIMSYSFQVDMSSGYGSYAGQSPSSSSLSMGATNGMNCYVVGMSPMMNSHQSSLANGTQHQNIPYGIHEHTHEQDPNSFPTSTTARIDSGSSDSGSAAHVPTVSSSSSSSYHSYPPVTANTTPLMSASETCVSSNELDSKHPPMIEASSATSVAGHSKVPVVAASDLKQWPPENSLVESQNDESSSSSSTSSSLSANSESVHTPPTSSGSSSSADEVVATSDEATIAQIISQSMVESVTA